MRAVWLAWPVDLVAGLRADSRGWTCSQLIILPDLLDPAGGESMLDLDALNGAPGLRNVLDRMERPTMGDGRRAVTEMRWRTECVRSVP